MSDSSEIITTLTEHEPMEMPMYKSEQWSYLSDYNNSSYPTQVQFRTTDVKNKKIIWRDAYVQLPLCIFANTSASPAAPFNATTKVALKSSVLDFVYGLTLNNIGQGTIVNDSQIQFINQVRLILDTNTDFIEAKDAELMMGIDDVVWNPATPTGHPISTQADPTGIVAGTNHGLYDRIRFVQQKGFQETGELPPTGGYGPNVANSFNFNAYIPLRLCHPIFDTMDFVMYGSNFELYLALSFLSNNVYPPLMVDTSTSVVIPRVTINTSAGPCRLYYKSVEFEPSQGELYKRMLDSGLTIRRDYLACDTYVLPDFQDYGSKDSGASHNQNINNYQITASVVNPSALHVLLFPAKSFTGPTIGDSDTTTPVTLVIEQGPFTLPRSPVGGLTNTSVYLNQTNVFPDTQLITTNDYWDLLRQRLVGNQSDQNGSPISFYDFVNAQRINWFPLDKTAQKFKNQNVSLSFTTNLGTNQDQSPDDNIYDIVFLVEKQYSIEYKMSQGVTLISAGQNISA